MEVGRKRGERKRREGEGEGREEERKTGIERGREGWTDGERKLKMGGIGCIHMYTYTYTYTYSTCTCIIIIIIIMYMYILYLLFCTGHVFKPGSDAASLATWRGEQSMNES